MPLKPLRVNRRAVAAILCMWSGLAFLFLSDQINIWRKIKETREINRRDLTLVSPYSKEDVFKTQEIFASGCANLLMVFDGESGRFHTYYDERSLNSKRPDGANFIMAKALYTFFPKRFKPGSPPLQILFSTDDYPTIDLRNIDLAQEKVSADKKFAPVLQFGSVPRDKDIFDPVPIVEMPFAKILGCFGKKVFRKLGLGRCLFEEGTLPLLVRRVDVDIPSWDELKPQIVWRGADYQFLERFNNGMNFGNRLVLESDEEPPQTLVAVIEFFFKRWDNLYPRWKAVALSLKAELDAAQNQRVNEEESMPWIDFKFFEKKSNIRSDGFLSAGAMISTKEFLTYDEQMMYKYHIDFGGGGGTSWTGLLSKLAMPGVVFHHETIMRDFYFDHIQPWVHYIPVKEDLSDLRLKFEWAEANPDKARAISEAATEFIQTMDTRQWFSEMYKHYFKERLGNVVDAYVPSDGESVHTVVREYRERGIKLKYFSDCDKNRCHKPFDGYGFDFTQKKNGSFTTPIREEE